MNANSYHIVKYFQELARSSDSPKVMVDRNKLRELINMARNSPRYHTARAAKNKLESADNA